MTRFARLTLFLPLLALAACHGESIDRDVSSRVTIRQGIYGQATYDDDTGAGTSYLKDFVIQVHAVLDGPNPVGPQLTQTTSGAQGFYEITLDPGSYFLCTTYARCMQYEVVATKTRRADFEMGPGFGWM